MTVQCSRYKRDRRWTFRRRVRATTRMSHASRAAIVCFVALLSLGKPKPAAAQVDFTGAWATQITEDQPERIPGPELGDYLGLPINDAARLYADSWDASRLTLIEHQCRAHTSPYIYRGPLNLRIWEERDPLTQELVAIKQFINAMAQTRTIYMDGRPHPPEYALHTWQGFSTGTWDGKTLTVKTTHIKQGWVRRNGLPQSAEATSTEHFTPHGDYLTHVMILNDPIFLTEPLIKTQHFVRADDLQTGAWQNWLSCEAEEEVAGRPRGLIPHHLPGMNPSLKEFASRFKLPAEATRGGAETMYPEYQPGKTLRNNARPVAPPNNVTSVADDIRIAHVQGNIYVAVGPEGNSAIQVADQGIVLVDTQPARFTDKLLTAIRKVSDKPLRYIINTNADLEHTGGNDRAAAAGSPITGRNLGTLQTPIIAHENVLSRMSAVVNGQPQRPVPSWPTSTYFTEEKDMFFNSEAIQLLHQPAAHTDGDSFVFFRRSDVIATGEIYVTTGYPSMDLDRGGSVQGVIDGLNRLLDLMVPGEKEEGGTIVIPGRGRLSDEADVVEYRDMVTIVRDRVLDLIKKGRKLEDVIASKPTFDYDAIYGEQQGRRFVEAVYKSLVGAAKAAGPSK
jgi:cyclase